MTGEDRKKGHFFWVGWLIIISCLNSVQEIYVKEESCTIFTNWAWSNPPNSLSQEHRRKLWSQVWNWPFWAIKSPLMLIMGQRTGIMFISSGNGSEKNIQHKHYQNKNICLVWKRWFTQFLQLYCFLFDQRWFRSLGLYPNPSLLRLRRGQKCNLVHKGSN